MINWHNFICPRYVDTNKQRHERCIHHVSYEGSTNHEPRRHPNTSQIATCMKWMHVDYLKVTMLSDITDDTNTSICTWALNGNEQSNTTNTYPHQIKPPDNCWKKWNTSITKLFINNEQSSRVYKPLLNPITEVPFNPISQMPWEINFQTMSSMTEYIDALPPFYWTIIGDIQLPQDDGYHLAQVLRSGQTIYSYSDGSVKTKIAAHSYFNMPPRYQKT